VVLRARELCLASPDATKDPPSAMVRFAKNATGWHEHRGDLDCPLPARRVDPEMHKGRHFNSFHITSTRSRCAVAPLA
jgi:hypothetical protein